MTSSPSFFNYSFAIRKVCSDVVLRLPEFSAVRMEDVGISLIRSRNRQMYGVFASMTPLRSEDGSFITKRKGRLYQIPDIRDSNNRSLYYILSIYIPRFVDLTLTEKIQTIIHELYHISPSFNGDLRRFNGRCFAHGSSKKEYDQTVAKLAQKWLATDPDPDVWEFLRYDFKTLCERFGGVTGTKINLPPFILIK